MMCLSEVGKDPSITCEKKGENTQISIQNLVNISLYQWPSD